MYFYILYFLKVLAIRRTVIRATWLKTTARHTPEMRKPALAGFLSVADESGVGVSGGLIGCGIEQLVQLADGARLELEEPTAVWIAVDALRAVRQGFVDGDLSSSAERLRRYGT